MSYKTSYVPADCGVASNSSRLRRRRNAMANIFSTIDVATLQRNQWGVYSQSSQVCDGENLEVSEGETCVVPENDLPVMPPPETETPVLKDEKLPEMPSDEVRSSDITESSSPTQTYDILKYGLDNILRDLSEVQNGLSGRNNRQTSRKRWSRAISMDEVCAMLKPLDNRKRRNGSPYVLASITHSELQGLSDIFTSTVCDGSSQVFPFSTHIPIRS